MRNLIVLPKFPVNSHGLVRGSILIVVHPDIFLQLGLKIGERIPIGYDGEYVRYKHLTWDIDQLSEEIDMGAWEIAEPLDLSDHEKSMNFAKVIEYVRIVS